jgi:hypothetical protein
LAPTLAPDLSALSSSEGLSSRTLTRNLLGVGDTRRRTGRTGVLAGNLARVPAGRIEQRGLLRAEQPLPGTTMVVRGGRDTLDKLRGHAQRTARAWSLDGQPLLGISVFAVLGITLEELLARRFASFRTIYLPTAGELRERGFGLLATGQQPHYTILLRRADDRELEELLAALGAARHNPQYGGSSIWREEG